MEFTSYERVKSSLEHREPDRVPFDLGGAMVTGINVNSLRRLRKFLGLAEKAEVWEPVTQLGLVENDLVEKMGIDVLNVGPEPPSEPGLFRNLGLEGEHYRIIDEFGIGWQMPVEGGHYYDLYHHPLKDVETVAEVEAYPWPNALDPARYVKLKEKADRAVNKQKKAYVLGRMHSGMWETAMWMTGYEKFFMDMLQNEKVAAAIMEKQTEIKMQYWERALEAVGNTALVISCADDLGTQKGLLVSLELYKKVIWPYHKRLFEFIKKKAQSKVYIFFHNDGAIRETIPLLIEAGVDILNPVQVNCEGMGDTKALKREFGKDLTFWGGSCDTQYVLPFGTEQEVRDETRRRIEDLAPGGGFIFAPIHIIQGEVTAANIAAWWETLQEYGHYH